MSIPVLIQTYDEVRRLAIAGSVVAPGDFRLKKLATPLEQAGQKAPVFAKVGQSVNRLVESNEKTSAIALLELATLVNAILYTQGETGIEGELKPIETINLGRPKTQASARILKPLQDALTTTGSGRLELIRQAYERGAFHDLRLISSALTALDDTYSEIGDLVAQKILPLYGRAILPRLQATFDPKGRSGHVRRLVLMHRLDPETARPYLQRSLDEGSQEVRIAAIGCLGDLPDDLPFLLEQAKAKAKDVRTAALKALGSSGADDAAKVLCQAIESADFALAVEPIRASRNRALTALLHEAAEKQSGALLSGTEKDAKKLGKQNERMCLILECLRGRDDKKTEQLLLQLFGQAGRLTAIKGEPSGKDVFERLLAIMADGPTIVQAALVEAHATLPADLLGHAFVAACRSCKSADVFAKFSPYLTAKVDEKKKARDPAYAKREAIIELLVKSRTWSWHYDAALGNKPEFKWISGLDPKWLDLAVKLGRADLVEALAVPGHAKANVLLATLFQQELKESGVSFDLAGILDAMIRVGHPGATDATIELIMRSAKNPDCYRGFWLGPLILHLPKAEALPKLEALLPTLPEKMIDQLLDYIAELKNQ